MKTIAQQIDELRVFPRLFMIGYGWMLIEMLFWAMSLAELSGPQAALVSTMTAIFAPLTAFYVKTGTNWKEK